VLYNTEINKDLLEFTCITILKAPQSNIILHYLHKFSNQFLTPSISSIQSSLVRNKNRRRKVKEEKGKIKFNRITISPQKAVSA